MRRLLVSVLALALAAPSLAQPDLQAAIEVTEEHRDRFQEAILAARSAPDSSSWHTVVRREASERGLEDDVIMRLIVEAREQLGAEPSRPAPSSAGGPPAATRAEALAGEIIGRHPKRGDYRRVRSKFREQRGDYAGVFEDLEVVIRQGNPDPETLTSYGRAAYELGDYRLARDAAALALKISPNDPAAFAVLRLSEGRASRVTLPSSLGGETAGPRLVSGPPAAPPATVPVALSGPRAPPGAPSPASAAAPAAVAPSAARQSEAATEDARHALSLKDYPLAARHATRAIELNGRNARAWNYRAIAFNRMRRYADAVTDASAALGLAPGSGAALQTRSWAFAQQGRYQEALRDAEATLGADPRNAFAYQNKAFALAGLGDRAGALSALRASAALDPRFAAAYERAVQAPRDQDLTFLFDDAAAPAAAAPSRPAPTPARFLRLALLTSIGGLLIALGVLHVASASWRERVTRTVRRALGRPAPASAAPELSAAAFWTQYELVKEIGMGGMGVVYEARDRALERRVAVKKMRDELRADPRERARFVTEAKLVAKLRHPNIVDIYAIVEDGGDVYLVFEHVEGRTLHDRLRSEGVYGYAEGLEAFRAICAAVEHAHAAKIVHRDLKPSNVMVTADGRIKVMDFGVARQAKDALTRMSMTNTVVGTPPYMAPEQEQGTVRRESDVYALGVCFYEMLTGQLPFAGTGAALLLNKINGKHIPPTQRVPGLPAGLDSVLAKALRPDPHQRQRSAFELLRELEALV